MPEVVRPLTQIETEPAVKMVTSSNRESQRGNIPAYLEMVYCTTSPPNTPAPALREAKHQQTSSTLLGFVQQRREGRLARCSDLLRRSSGTTWARRRSSRGRTWSLHSGRHRRRRRDGSKSRCQRGGLRRDWSTLLQYSTTTVGSENYTLGRRSSRNWTRRRKSRRRSWPQWERRRDDREERRNNRRGRRRRAHNGRRRRRRRAIRWQGKAEREMLRRSAPLCKLLGEGRGGPAERCEPRRLTQRRELLNEARSRTRYSRQQLHTSQLQQSGNAREETGGWQRRSRSRRHLSKRGRDTGRRWPRRRKLLVRRLGLRLNLYRCLALPVLTELLHPCLMRTRRIRTPSPTQDWFKNSLHAPEVRFVVFVQERGAVHVDGVIHHHHRATGGEWCGQGRKEHGRRRGCRQRRTRTRTRTGHSPSNVTRRTSLRNWRSCRRRGGLQELGSKPAHEGEDCEPEK